MRVLGRQGGVPKHGRIPGRKYMSGTEVGRRWRPWIQKFFRARQFTISWDGKNRGIGRTNIGVPQSSPLSPVVFLVWMHQYWKRWKEECSR